jgi:hypothetical protein
MAAVRKVGPPMVDGRMSTAASLPEAFGIGGSGAVETVAERGSEPVGSVLFGDECCSGAAGAGVGGGGGGAAVGGVASAGIASRCGAADGSGAEFWNSLDLALAPASEALGTGMTSGAGSVGATCNGPGSNVFRGDPGARIAGAGD